MQPFSNVMRLFRGLRRALTEPEVQGVVTLALTLIAIATIFYCLVEGWSRLDAAYFSVVTIATVGYGDIAPHMVIGKLFIIGYIFTGIGIFALAVGTLALATMRKDSSSKD